MYVRIVDATAQVLVRRNVIATPAAFLEIVTPYQDDLLVAAKCMFTWYFADVRAAKNRVKCRSLEHEGTVQCSSLGE